MNNFIRVFSEHLRTTLLKHSSGTIKRTRKIGILEIFDCISYQVQCKTYSNTTAYLLDNRGIEISDAALVYRRKQIEESFFTNVYDDIYDKFRTILSTASDTDYTLQMVDGSNITLLPTFEKYGFKTVSNSKLTHGLLTGIYNQTDDTITSFKFGKSGDERGEFLDGMKFINLESTRNVFVFDRGYWRPEIAMYLLEQKHDFVFRMNKINNNLTPLKDGTKDDYVGTFRMKRKNLPTQDIKVRYLRYDIGESQYFIATSLFHTPISEIKEIYLKRWSIEVLYKLLKDVCDLGLTKHKTPAFYIQNLQMFRILYLMHKIIYKTFLSMHNTNRQHAKINKKQSMYTIINHIMGKLLYRPPGYTSKVSALIGSLFKHFIVSLPNRSFSRIALSMASKWYLLGAISNNRRANKKPNTETNIIKNDTPPP
jgi:hypothetical protein